MISKASCSSAVGHRVAVFSYTSVLVLVVLMVLMAAGPESPDSLEALHTSRGDFRAAPAHKHSGRSKVRSDLKDVACG